MLQRAIALGGVRVWFMVLVSSSAGCCPGPEPQLCSAQLSSAQLSWAGPAPLSLHAPIPAGLPGGAGGATLSSLVMPSCKLTL
ncbi:hypothetical protein V8C86DRAFT_1739848 [Haematococcus lacustris]